MGEVIARSTEDDSVSEDAGPSGRQVNGIW